MSEKRFTCPSGPAEAGSVLLGVVAERGELAYISPNVPVTPSLLRNLKIDTAPIENRFRFANACIEHKCVQWKGREGVGHCGLIESATKQLERSSPPESLPSCGIRASCRWFAQKGTAACGVCPQIIRRPANECRAAD